MKLLGLTGGVGMGKTTVGNLLIEAGVIVIDTDQIARQVVEKGMPAWLQIHAEFGPAYFHVDGSLNRQVMAQLVFKDSLARKKLEDIIHPRIREMWMAEVGRLKQQGNAMCVVVIPLLFETEAEREFDQVICVACSAGSQRARLTSRGWTENQAQQRIRSQMPIAEKMMRADRVIWTEGPPAITGEQLSRHLASIRDSLPV